MSAYSDFKAWCERSQIMWVDKYPYDSQYDALQPGRLCLSEDLRWVRDLNIDKDKKRCMLYFDGKHMRSIDGLTKIKEVDEFTWTVTDKHGSEFRIYGWWHRKQLAIKDDFVKRRYMAHSMLMNRCMEMYQGDIATALQVQLPPDDRPAEGRT